MNPPHKNVDFSDGQREPLWIHVASTVITLLISHHITFGLAWLNPHYHKLINTSVAALKRHFINKLTISYIFSINPPKKKMFHRIRLHLWLCQSPANINREINWFSHLSWYVCVFGDAEWGFCRIANIWISHKDLLNKIVDFSVGSQALSGFIPHWCLLWVYVTSIHANQAGNIRIDTHRAPTRQLLWQLLGTFKVFPSDILRLYLLAWLSSLRHYTQSLLGFKTYVTRMMMLMYSL